MTGIVDPQSAKSEVQTLRPRMGLLHSMGLGFGIVCLVFLLAAVVPPIGVLLWPGFAVAGAMFGEWAAAHSMVGLAVIALSNWLLYALLKFSSRESGEVGIRFGERRTH